MGGKNRLLFLLSSCVLPSRPLSLSRQAMMTAHYNPAHWGTVTHEHVSEFILSHLRYTGNAKHFWFACSSVPCSRPALSSALPTGKLCLLSFSTVVFASLVVAIFVECPVPPRTPCVRHTTYLLELLLGQSPLFVFLSPIVPSDQWHGVEHLMISTSAAREREKETKREIVRERQRSTPFHRTLRVNSNFVK